MADLELDNLFKSIANQDFSTEKKSELDEIFDNIKNNKFVSKERELLDDVFQNNPQIVDYYFTERGKNPEFQLTKDAIKQFNLEKQVPKLSFDSISGFFKSAASQKDTDLDRFSNLTGTKFVYPLKNSDEQNELNTYYNVTRRAKPWKEQEYKPSFSENIAIGSAEGLNRGAKGVATAVAELVDRGFDTDYTTAIENNWATMNLEDNGVADFARFSVQYGVPYGTSLKIFNKLKSFRALGEADRKGKTLGRTTNFLSKIGYYGAPAVPVGYAFTSDESDAPYIVDDLGKMMGLTGPTSLDDEANLYGSEKAAVAMRNRFKMALNEGITVGTFGAALPTFLKGIWLSLAGQKNIGGTMVPYGVGRLAMSGLQSNFNMAAMILGKSYNGASWGMRRTGEFFQRRLPTERMGMWYKNAIQKKFPRYEDWKMNDYASSSIKERFKASVARTLEYVNSNGRWSPSNMVLKRSMENRINSTSKLVEKQLDEMERIVYNLGDEVNLYGQKNSELRREMLYDGIIRVLKNPLSFGIHRNKQLFPTKELRDGMVRLHKLIEKTKKDGYELNPKLFDEYFGDLRNYFSQSYAVLKVREGFSAPGKIIKEAGDWFYDLAKKYPGMTRSKSTQIIKDLLQNAKTGNLSARELEDIVNTTLKRYGAKDSMLRPGEKMPQMLQKLFGKETDARRIIMETARQFSEVAQKGKFYKKLIEQSRDETIKGFNRGKPLLFKGDEEAATNLFRQFYPGATGTKLVPVKVLRNTLVPVGDEIEQFFTTPAFAKALFDDGIFMDALFKGGLGSYIRPLLGIKTAINTGKTVLSQVTVARNFITAVFFPGIMGFIGKGSDIGTAFSYMLKDIAGKGKMSADEFMPLVKEFSEQGMTDQSVVASEFSSLLSQIGSGKLDTTAKIAEWVTNNALMKKLVNIYQGGDYIWRFYGYIGMKDFYKSVLRNKKDVEIYYNQIFKRRYDSLDGAGKEIEMEQIIKDTAGEMINASFPTYSRVPYITQAFKVNPLFGNFVSFSSEMLRTVPQNLLFAFREINFRHPDKAVQEAINYAGWRRYLGLTGVASSAYVLIDQALKLTGITQEQLDAYQDEVAAPYNKSLMMPVTPPDEEGRFYVVNLSTMIPQAPWLLAFEESLEFIQNKDEQGLMSNLNDRIFGKNYLLGGDKNPGIMDHFFGAYSDMGIYFDNAKQVLFNQKTTGGSIWTENFDTWENGGKGKKILNFLWGKLLPSTVGQTELFTGALNQDLDSDGEPVSAPQQFLKLGGISAQQVDPKRSLSFDIGDYSKSISNTSAGFKSEAYNDVNLTKQKTVDSYKKELISRFKEFKKFKKMLDAYKILGVTEDDFYSHRKRDEMYVIPRVLENEFEPRAVRLTDPSLQKLADRIKINGESREVEDIVDIDRIMNLYDLVDGLPINDIFYSEDDREVQEGIRTTEDIKIKGTTVEEFINLLENPELKRKPEPIIDQQPTDTLQDLINQLQISAITQPQAIAAKPQVAPPVATGTAQGVTPTETALLSPTELAIRQRNRGTA